jgi:predicted nucleotidyltransferase
MDMKDEWVRKLAAWASSNGSIRELWLFGSRADDTSRPDSDIDIGVGLMPPKGKHDWAFGNYTALGDQWQRDLSNMLDCRVSLENITPEQFGTAKVREWVLLWKRPDGSSEQQ